MDKRRFVVWDADGRPLGTFFTFEAAHRWAHVRLRLNYSRLRLPLTLDDRVAKVSRRMSRERCELVAWVEFAVLAGCDLPASARTVDGPSPLESAGACTHEQEVNGLDLLPVGVPDPSADLA